MTFGIWCVISTASTRQAVSIALKETRPARRTLVNPSRPRTVPRFKAIYLSGMHSFETEDVILDAQDLARYLWQRLYGERA